MKIPALLLIVTCICLAPVLDAKVVEEPIFVRWMSATQAVDQIILSYWDQVKKNELSAKGLVDLGTMLFRRGFPNDALDMYERSLEKEEFNPEAHYRIGLVEHKKGNLRQAKSAYKDCLKQMSGHGWCNFYLGYLEEGKGNAKKALEYYTTAFRHAPELADPEVNPEVLYSKLFVGALIRHTEESRFARAMPMPFLEPGKVKGTANRMRNSIEAESLKNQPAKRSPEKAAVQPATPPKKGSTAATGNQSTSEPPPKSAQEAKPTPNPEVKTGLSPKTSPKMRRPRRLRITPIPKPDVNQDQPAEEKPPADPSAG